MSEIATFDMAPLTSSIIMVAGIGGGGGNAVNHMFRLGAADVSFMVCNTDKQALERSPVPNKILLGNGLGAGNRPERARQAAEEGMEEIKEALRVNETKMLFVTAGMGGGTGTGAAPVVARIAKEMGILTVGIVSIPFKGEGPKRVEQAIAGIEELSGCVDSLIVINNEHIAQIHGKLPISQALAKADDILAMAAKSIADIITAYADVNVDFADVTTVMKDSGVALMGSAQSDMQTQGVLEIAQAAINSPLLHHNSIRGARNVLLNITSGTEEICFEDSQQILEFIQESSGLGNQTDVIWGSGRDELLGNNIRITIVATGFDTKNIPAFADHYRGMIKPGVTVSTEPTREVVDFDAPELPVVKKDLDQESVDGFEVVVRQGGEQRQAPVVSEPAGRMPSRADRLAAEEVLVSEDAMIHVDESTFDTPAFMRRNITLYNEPRDPSVKSERLEGSTTAASAAQAEASHVSLFD